MGQTFVEFLLQAREHAFLLLKVFYRLDLADTKLRHTENDFEEFFLYEELIPVLIKTYLYLLCVLGLLPKIVFLFVLQFQKLININGCWRKDLFQKFNWSLHLILNTADMSNLPNILTGLDIEYINFFE